jgi:hypothetical protein
VTNVTPNGVWLLVDRKELFAAFRDFPWFRGATIDQILQVERPNPRLLRWPALDVDLAVESLEHPKRYPLISRLAPKPAKGAPRSRRPS